MLITIKPEKQQQQKLIERVSNLNSWKPQGKNCESESPRGKIKCMWNKKKGNNPKYQTAVGRYLIYDGIILLDFVL